MSKPRLKKVLFAGSSNKLRARALVRIGVEHTIKTNFFRPEVIRISYLYC